MEAVRLKRRRQHEMRAQAAWAKHNEVKVANAANVVNKSSVGNPKLRRKGAQHRSMKMKATGTTKSENTSRVGRLNLSGSRVRG